MKKDVLKVEEVEGLLQKLYQEILEEVEGISSIELSDLNHPYQDARLVSVKGVGMSDYKSSGAAFLGKETNPKHLNLPNGEYVHIDEFVSALNKYYNNHPKRQYIVESNEDKQKRKISEEKLGEFKSFVSHATALHLSKITKVTTQDARLVSARSNENLGYFKPVGGAFLGSENNNIKKGYPSQLLPKDQVNYINKEELIKALDNLFEAKKKALVLPLIVPVLQPMTPTEMVVQTETVQQQEVSKEINLEVEKYSDSLVIGDVLRLEEGVKFYHDSWESPAIGEVGEIYSPAGNYTVNSFVVRNTETGYYEQYMSEGNQLEQVINELKKSGKITDNNVEVYYHVGLGPNFLRVGEGADRGWIKYDENTYPVEKRMAIGKEIKSEVYTDVEETHENVNQYFYAELNDISSPKLMIEAETDGKIVTLRNKDAEYIDFSQLSDGEEITLVDENEVEYKLTKDDISFENEKYKLKLLVPILIPMILTDKSKEKEEVEKDGGKTR